MPGSWLSAFPTCLLLAMHVLLRGVLWLKYDLHMSDRPEEPLRVSADLMIPAAELRWSFSRSRGPGGQGVNTTDSRVEVTWCPAGSAALTTAQLNRLERHLFGRMRGDRIRIVASEQRSQYQNRVSARQRLARIILVALAAKPKRRHRTRPSRSSVARRAKTKQQRSQLKQHRRRPTRDD
jgi:ribosome-associated protein